MKLSEYSQIEAKLFFVDKHAIALIPIGSQEQHGYLPTGIDILLAEGFAYKLSKILNSYRILSFITPTINFGFSPICDGFPGTISLSETTFRNLVTEIIKQLIKQNISKIVLINGHRDNHNILEKIISDITKTYKNISILNPIYALLRTNAEFKKKYPNLKIPDTVIAMDKLCDKVGLLRHADSAEMSLFYALYPRLQKKYEKKLNNISILPDLHAKLPSTHEEWVKVTAECKGGTGDPRNIDIHLANIVIQSMMIDICKMIDGQSRL